MPREVEDLKGSTYPSWIWKQYMEYASEGLKPLNFLPYAKLSDGFIEEYYPPETEEPTETQVPDVPVEPTDSEGPVEGGNSENAVGAEVSEGWNDVAKNISYFGVPLIIILIYDYLIELAKLLYRFWKTKRKKKEAAETVS
jgi:hypothetical protein